jgi:ankyrin repeat protein
LVDLVIARASDPDADSSAVMKWAETLQLGQVVTKLLKDQSNQQYRLDSLEFVLVWAVTSDCARLVKLLLTDPRIDPSVHRQFLIRRASQNGHAEVVKVLLADPRADPSAENQYAIEISSELGHVDVVKLLLADKRVDPSAGFQHPIRIASANGHAEVVKVLLADSRVNPSTFDQSALRVASEPGHAEVVKLLLADKRVDPSAGDHDAICMASRNGSSQVVKLLLADPRVDPSAQHQYSIHWASSQGHAEVVKLLLADQRVDISGLSCPSDLVLVLFLLRRSFRLGLKPTDFDRNSHLRSVLADIEKVEAQRKALLDAHLISDLSSLCLEYVPDLFCHLDTPLSSLFDNTYMANTNNSKNDEDWEKNDDARIPHFSFAHLSTL